MWTQQRISDWADETFGEVLDNTSLIMRADGELDELYDAAEDLEGVSGLDPHYEELESKLMEEAADIMIVLMRIFEYRGAHFQDIIDKKMEVNVKRKWTKFGNGHGQHDGNE